ncbi:hypothetical protein SDC9_185389 [bioreactor metagenome]|uniref:Uncharacterized protein n=1 Tax=bioreactor metagenome TaxID=1076179 RepID=A0A645HFR5_9ZZZZ
MFLSFGNTNGRSVNECGEIGVIHITAESGKSIGPPQASEYAVDPVGVDIISPSAL